VTIKTHPLVPKDIVVRGFIIDSETGALEEIKTIELFP
jgi:carbonic anhydrase